jgi:DUF4097 and DUF4098 domain-containing protein YvlB
MSATRYVFLSLALVAAPVYSVEAQKDDSRWLRDCQRGDHDDSRERFCEVRHTGFRSTGAIDVDPGPNGGVSVEGWDRDSVDISVRVSAGAETEADAKAIAADVEVQAKGGRIRVEGPSTRRREYWATNLVIRVPNKSNVDVTAVNGPIGVSDVTGTMRLRTTNGPVSLEQVGGDVRARLQNGPLSVALSGREWTGAGLDAESVNGPVTLTIPEEYNADLETGTVNGPMQSSRPLTVTFRGRMQSRIQTKLGKGGAPVRVVTTNGPLTIE